MIAPVGMGLLLIISVLQFGAGAQAQKAGEPVELRGFATGTDAHLNLLQSGTTRLVDTEVAWSGAAVDADADGLKGAKLNEMNRVFQPDKPGKLSYARGSGLELGVGTTPVDENQLQLTGKAEASAPKKSFDQKSTDIDVDPVANASLLRGTALANSNDSGLVPDVCVLGDDLARGTGYAADVELVDTGGDTQQDEFDAALVALDDQDPQRSVSQSTSRLALVPGNGPNNFGLMSEVRETIAPVTLLQVDPAKPQRLITIEVLGEWVLRVVANGSKASVFYGPGKVSPQSDILRILDSDAAEALVLSFQDLLGNEGLDLSDDLLPLLGVTVGEDPRAIAAPGKTPDPTSKPTLAANGTKAAAAVDVVRIQLLSLPDPQAAEIRIGHMETEAEVPVGGINCPIPVEKGADPNQIKINEQPDTSHVSITVRNVYDCDLTNVMLTDHITPVNDSSPNFKISKADPTPDSPDVPTGVLTRTDVVWSLGTIKKGSSSTVTLDLQSASEGGVLRDVAEAAGKFANCTGQDASGLAISGLDLTGLSAPVDVNIETPVTGAAASRTAATGGVLFLGAVALGLVLRRRFPRSA